MARTPKTLDQARANLESVIPLIPERYRAGAERAKWAEAAASDAAEANFAQAMQQVIAQKLRQAGVRRAGDQKWRSGVLEKGVPIIGQRIQGALDIWQRNFGRVYEAVLRTVATLPPKTLDPMQNVDRRLKPVVRTAVENKIRGRAG